MDRDHGTMWNVVVGERYSCSVTAEVEKKLSSLIARRDDGLNTYTDLQPLDIPLSNSPEGRCDGSVLRLPLLSCLEMWQQFFE